MDISEYSRRALAVAGPLTHKETVAHAALGIASEVAELLEEINLIRKDGVVEGTQARIMKEVGDVAWYINQMLDTLGQGFDDLSNTLFTARSTHFSGANFVEVSDKLTNDMCICVGHIADHAKRLTLTKKPVPVAEMLSTLARLWHSLGTLASLADLTWAEIFDANIEKLESRYKGTKFSVVGSESHRVAAANDGGADSDVPDGLRLRLV